MSFLVGFTKIAAVAAPVSPQVDRLETVVFTCLLQNPLQWDLGKDKEHGRNEVTLAQPSLMI
jgi:hypothetical protein